MNQHNHELRVFVSSTSKDLLDYRAVARNMILKIGWYPEMMEYFTACPDPTVKACYKKLKKADLVLLIIAHRRGWVPTEEQGGNGTDSITALELAYARGKSIPVLAMMANETWPGNLWEDNDEARAWVKKFRENLNQIAEFFDFEQPTGKESEILPAFQAKVQKILLSHKEHLLSEESTQAQPGNGLDYFESACQGFIEGESIPFLGHGIYGQGPLSTQVLCSAFGEVKFGEASCVATMAEYRERYLKKRNLFLNQLNKVINEQAQQVENPAVHDMILKGKTPILVVSASYDLVLEDRLDTENRSYVVVSHIIRSFEGENDGKILVWRKDKPLEITVADQLDIKGVDFIIYKPLGSPLLNAKLDPDLGIDTVVITETDHLTFLGRLENQHTQIPTAFSRLFQRNSLLFLGYALDVWQYRLVMGVFQLLGAKGKPILSQTVRIPTSRMEELSWQRLGADMILMEPNDFAQKVCNSLGEG